jgi:DNA (cytosine-5)-methyltransferase 1
MPTCGSLFSGGGLADWGLRQSGFTPIWAIEQDHAAADCYAANLGAHVIRADVRAVDPRTLESVDLLWASPPCTMFSAARSRGLPTNGSEDLGLACIPFLEALRPAVFLLENVPPYVASVPFRAIVAALHRLGYLVDWSNLDAADFGTAQHRNRLILRASRLGLLPPLPAPVPHVGWYAAIADLLPSLPESRFADWQLARLANHPLAESFLLMTGNTQMANPTGTGIRQPEEPANTVLAGSTTARAHGG